MKKLLTALSVYFDWFYIPKIHVTDIIEIIILSYVIYHVMIWFKKTRAWTLFKGIVVLFIFVGLATLFRLNTILWIFRNTISVGIIAVIILFQPELRRALEELDERRSLQMFWRGMIRTCIWNASTIIRSMSSLQLRLIWVR